MLLYGLFSLRTTVRLGELNLDNQTDCSEINRKRVCAPPVEDFGIEEILSHPGFSLAKLSDDIALIRLNQTVTFKGNLSKAPLALSLTNKN